jgi:divalent metal cation (Fe/Co/Zn/Cd) transporter
MDEAPNDELITQARQIASSVPGVKGVEKCFARKMGYHFVLDMHLEVEATMTVADSHELGHLVKDTIRSGLPRVSDVTVHIEPYRKVVDQRLPI